MSNGELSVLTDHDNSNRLSHADSNQYLIINLQYVDQQRRGSGVRENVPFPLTATIEDVRKKLLEIFQLDNKRPEDVTLVRIKHNQQSHLFIDNMHAKLSALDIPNGSTLCFEPSKTVTSKSLSSLTILMPYPMKKLQFEWNESKTKLHELVDYIIEKRSLNSIPRDRIHLFHRFEEIDVSLHGEKTMKELGIMDQQIIDVEIIPPISPSTTNAKTDLFDSLRGKDFIQNIPSKESNTPIVVGIEVKDHSRNIPGELVHGFPPTTKIYDIIKKYLQSPNLKHISLEDVEFVGYGMKKLVIPVKSSDKYQTLDSLKIDSGHTIFCEVSTVSKPKEVQSLTIELADDVEKVKYEWNETTTTLGQLLDYIIEEFSFSSIERQRIRLTTSKNEELDHLLHSDRLLADFNLKDIESVIVTIIPEGSSSTSNAGSDVHVKCTYSTGSKWLDVPISTTIEELKIRICEQFKDYLIIEWKLFDRMHRSIDTNERNQPLSYFGVEPDQEVYVAIPKLVYSGNPSSKSNTNNPTTPRTSSLITKSRENEVTVRIVKSGSQSNVIKVSVNNTVGDLLKRLEPYKENRSSAEFSIYRGSTRIDIEKVNQSLSSFGVTTNDTIEVTLIEKTQPKYVLAPSEPTFRTTDLSLGSSLNPSKPWGLSNLGNTCYMNSALQCLAHTKPLTQFFLDTLKEITPQDEKNLGAEWNQFYDVGSVTGAYADLLRNLYLSSQNLYHSLGYPPKHFRDTIAHQAPRFAGNEQQDAQEFLTYLLDEIHKEFKEKNGHDSSTIIEDLFFGRLQSTVTCLACENEVKSTNIFSLLSLPIHQRGFLFIVKFIKDNDTTETAAVTVPEDGLVKDIIRAFTELKSPTSFWNRITAIVGEDQVDLDVPVNRLPVKEVTLVEHEYIGSVRFEQIYKSSKKLTLETCLQDFCMVEHLEDACLCQQETCQKHAQATKQLQFASLPPVLVIQLKRFSHENGIREKIETFVEYPIRGLNLTNLLLPPPEKEVIYDLFAVSMHTGSIYGGHYIAYAQHESNGLTEWSKFDDWCVYSYPRESEIVSKDAYLLFYMRRDQPEKSLAVSTS